jgi:SAM-dependent methyltransferase
MIDADRELRLRDTRDAFDSVAADYDGPRGNNALIQDMRAEMWRWLERTMPPAGQLLDLGCGTGIDAVHLAKLGHRVTAIDWSPRMVERTEERAQRAGLELATLAIGAHELERLPGQGTFDGIYSNLGPLNCVPDLSEVAEGCARLVRRGGTLVFTVIGRLCPWEILHFGVRGRWSRIGVRFARRVVPVGMNRHRIWTRYYTPREFYAAFTRDFFLEHHRGVCVLVPPPYLTTMHEKHPRLFARLWDADRRIAGWPLVRTLGDHFLIVMRRR